MQPPKIKRRPPPAGEWARSDFSPTVLRQCPRFRDCGFLQGCLPPALAPRRAGYMFVIRRIAKKAPPMTVKSATVTSAPRPPAGPAGRAAAFGREEIAALAKALAPPARVKVVEALLRRRSCIGCDLVEEVGLAASPNPQPLRIPDRERAAGGQR